MTTEEVFTDIYRRNAWNSEETVSGAGSAFAATAVVRKRLVELIREYRIKSVLDLGCGDCNWIKHVLLDVPYIGIDVVADIVDANRQRYGSDQRLFLCADGSRDDLPTAELIIARDCLVHLSVEDVFRTIRNIKRSGATWLLTTTFPDHPHNKANATGDWAPYNLMAEPFSFPPPFDLINEDCQ
ncbi:MAG: class I SAM-dependent methyltransferase, partial [Minisyncoccia bacterium]